MVNPFNKKGNFLILGILCVILLSSAVVYAQESEITPPIESEIPVTTISDIPATLLSRTAKLIKETSLITNEQAQTLAHQKEQEERLTQIYNILRVIEQNTRKK